MPNIIDSIRMSGTTYAISDSGGTKVVEITQSDYDNLPTSAKTANIMYVITDAEPFDVSNYYTKDETSGATELATAFAATQPKLSAGTNITIDANNVISAEGGGGKAVSGGTNISITTGETADTINCTLPITANTVADSYVFGKSLTGDNYSILIGTNAQAKWSNYSVAIIPKSNPDSKVTYQSQGGVLVGASTHISGFTSNGGSYSVAIGYGTRVTGSSSVAIGQNASVSGNTSIAIGRIASARGTSSVAIGSSATANGVDYNTNINNQIKVTPTNQIYIYNKDNTEMICLQDNLGGGGGGIDSGTVQTMIDQSISGKTNQTDFVSHSGNTSIHVTTAQTAAWDAKSDFSGSYNDLTDKPTIPIVPTNVSSFNNDAGYITSNDISGKTNQSDFVSHSGNTTMHVTASEKSTWNNKSDFSGNYNDLSNKPTIPTSASQLTNDSGYITSSALNGYATEDYVTAATNDMATKTWVGQQGYLTQHQDISGKQDVSGMTAYTTTATTNTLSGTVTAHTADTTIHVTAQDKTNWNNKSDFSGSYNDLTNKLSAGTNITIVDNVISAESGGGGKAVSGGTNISITSGETVDTINCTLPISADSKGIYTTSTYPFLSTSNKSGNVVFGYNNRLDTFGSSKNSNNNLFFGSDNYMSVNGSGMLIGGLNNKNSGNYTNMTACVALGNSNIVGNPYEFASGCYNQTYYNSTSFGLSGNTLFSVGNGWSNTSRHSAFEIRQNGDIYIADTNDTSTTNWYQKPMIKLQDALGGGGSSYTAGDGIDITNDVISVTGMTAESAFTAHTADTTVHTTAAEKTSWNSAATNASNAITALGGLSLVKLTQSEYDNLSTKDNSTLYVIVN